MQTIECRECGWITDIESHDPTAPTICPECRGDLQDAGTGADYPVTSKYGHSRETYRGQCYRCGLVGDWTPERQDSGKCPHCEHEAGFQAIR